MDTRSKNIRSPFELLVLRFSELRNSKCRCLVKVARGSPLSNQAIAAAGDTAAKISVRAFTASERYIKTEQDVVETAWHYNNAEPIRVPQAALVEPANAGRNFSSVIKRYQINR